MKCCNSEDTEAAEAMSATESLDKNSLDKNSLDKDSLEKDSLASDENTRGNWGNKIDFLLSCVGYAVGLGNLWRFPYLCMRNGGGAFLIPYFFFMAVCGMPLFFMELAVGQFASLSPMSVWSSICPLFTGLGYAMVLVSGVVCVYYNVIMAWGFYYIFKSFTKGQLPWATCSNDWNTESCVERLHGRDDLFNTSANSDYNVSLFEPQFAAPANLSGNFSLDNSTHKPMTAAEEFWHFNVLQLSDGIENLGPLRLELTLCLFIAWITVFFCLFKGIKTSGKVVYVTAVAPYLMMGVFLVRGLTLPGAWNGIKFYLYPDFSKLLRFGVWSEACAQIFYSLGPAYGSLITMASYNKFNNNCYRDAVLIPLINCGTSFVAGFAIFSVIGFMALQADLPVSKVITSGPGLAFVAYPEALTKLPISQFWAVVFFTMLVIIGLDTQFGMFECLISGFVDTFPKILIGRKTLFTGAICCLQMLLGLPLVTKGGIYVFQIFDWYAATFSLITISFLECVIIGWLYGADRLCADMRMMFGNRNLIWWKICWKFITPFILAVILIVTIINFSEPTYGTYVYPRWAIMLGWLLAMCSLLPIPIFMVFKLAMTPGSLLTRISLLIRPSTNWGPALQIHRTGRYKAVTVLNDADEKSSLKSADDICKEGVEKLPLDQDFEKQPLDPEPTCEKIYIEDECNSISATA